MTITRPRPIIPMRPACDDFADAEEERRELLASTDVRVLYGSTKSTLVPLVSQHCMCCEQLVDLCDQGSFGVTRINGDSRYGYEAYHESCLAEEERRMDAELKAENREADDVVDSVVASLRSIEAKHNWHLDDTDRVLLARVRSMLAAL